MAYGANLFVNPGAESDPSGWGSENATIDRVTSPVRTGAGAFRLVSAGAGTVQMYRQGELSQGLGPGAPVLLQAWVRTSVARQATLRVDWSGVNGYVGDAGTPFVTTTVGQWTLVSGTLTMPATANRGFFYLRVVDVAGGETIYVDDLSLQSEVSNPPAKVSGVVVGEVLSSSVALSWQPVADATSYTVRRGGVVAASGVTGTQTVVGSLTASTAYTFTVEALAGTVPGPASDPVQATTLAPTRSVWVSWTVPSAGGSAITGHVVQRRTGTGAWSTIATLPPAATFYEDKTALTGTAYGYRHAAQNNAGTATFSAEQTITP